MSIRIQNSTIIDDSRNGVNFNTISLTGASALSFSTTDTAVFNHASNSTPVAFQMNKGGSSFSDGSNFGVLQLSRTNHNNAATSAGGALYFVLKDNGGTSREYAGILGRKTGAGASGGELVFMNYARNEVGYCNASLLSHVSSVRAPIFYDSNNTSYYVDPASTSQVNTLIGGLATPNANVIGNIRAYGSTSAYMGASDSSRTAFFGVDSSNYAMFGALSNHDVVLRASNTERLRCSTGNYTIMTGSSRAPIFYDSNNTGYYIDPDSGGFVMRGGASNRVTYSTNDSGFLVQNAEGNGVGDVRLGAAWGRPGIYSSSYLSLGSSGTYTEFVFGNVQRGFFNSSGTMQANGDMRAPIFYDSNNTGYYVDPASTSNLFNVTVRAGGAFAAVTDLGYVSPIQVSQTQIGTSANRFVPMISGTSLSPSGYRQHTVFGSLRGTVWGSAFIAVGGNDSYPTTTFTFHYDGYGTAPNSWRAPIFYDSNNTGYYLDPNGRRSSNIDGFSARTKMTLGLTAKYQLDRADYTADTNYWVGTMGWGTTDMNSVFDWGSGFIDSWSNPGNQPAGTSHWVGVQAMHYTNNSTRYGWQMVGGPIGNLRFRNTWPSFSGWRTIPVLGVNDNNTGGMYADIYYDSNNTGFYVDPNSESRQQRVRVGPYAGSVSSGNVTGLELINNGGTGDSNVAAMSFHCSGTYGMHMHLRHDSYFGIGGWSASTWRWYVQMSTGNMTAAGNVTAFSDPRLKENITKIESPLKRLSNLNGVRFRWKDSSVIGNPGSYDYGVLADEVESEFPELVYGSAHKSPDGDEYKTVAYDKLIPVLIEAIKELRVIVEKQQRVIEELQDVD